MNFYLRQVSLNTSIDQTEQQKIEIVIGKDGVPNKKISTNNKKEKQCVNNYIINVIKLFFITSFISWSTVYLIYKTIDKRDNIILLSSSSHVLFVIQYILGSIYYRSKHFKNICKDHLDILNKYNVISFSISVLIALIALLLLVFDQSINVYSNIYNSFDIPGKIIICILLIIDKTISYTIFLTNIMLFVFVFFIHINKVKEFRNILNKKIDDNEHIELNVIVNDYSSVKSQYSKSVDNFNSIFSSVSIFGLIQIYYVTNFDSDLIEYFNTFTFILIFIIQLYVISKITNTIDTIKSLINSKKFNELYNNTKIFDKYTTEIDDNSSDSKNKKISPKLNRLVYSRSDSISTLSYISEKSSDSDKKLNRTNSINTVSSKDSDKIKTSPKSSKLDNGFKISTIYSSKSSPAKSKDFVTSQKNLQKLIKSSKILKSVVNINENIDDINELQIRTLIKSYDNFFSNQWLILTTKLNSPWKKFEVLGYEISDTVPIKRVVGIVLLFLTSTNTIRSLLGI